MPLSFSPYLRYIAKSSHYIRNKYVVAPDCRLFYIISGEGKCYVKDYTYHFTPNTLLYFPYGTTYKIRSSKEKPLYFYVVNFDFCETFCNVPTIVPQAESVHNPDTEIHSISDDLSVPFSEAIYIKNTLSIERSISKMFDEYTSNEPCSYELKNAYLKIVLMMIYRHTQKGNGNLLCQKIKELILQHPEYNNSDVAKTLNYNPIYLNNLFKRTEGTTLHKFILRNKLSKAREMITETKLQLTTIAASCGFSSQAHLSAAFKKEYGISPGVIRKQT